MTVWKMPLAVGVVASTALFAQDMPALNAAVKELDLTRTNSEVARLNAEAARMAAEAARMDREALRFSGLNAQSFNLAMLQQNGVGAAKGPNPAPRPRSISVSYGRESGQYDNGTRLLDEHKYSEAIASFDRVISAKSERADGALYWKAYALNCLGQREEALAAIVALRRDYAASHWLNDAQVLEAEVKQNAGHPVSPAEESNEDIKLMAINSLMNSDPDRAMPLLEPLLKSGGSPRLKDRVLFVLTQSRSPRAQQILMEYAKGAGNPDLQLRAVRYIGMSGTGESQTQLAAIYTSTSDAAVKREILRSLTSGSAKEQLFNLAKGEKDAGLRSDAIRGLGALRATDQLVRLYTPDSSTESKTEIIRALMMTGASDKLLEMTRGEKDATVRMEAIRSLAATKSTSAESLVGMYTDSDAQTKHALINGLQARSDAKPLIEVFRKETDPAMKKYIVERLAGMRNNKEATDFMLELLK